ncbi:MAG: cell division protein FtsQ [Francisellaceae bacterium]|jgi:cell division protein FtsQ
MSVRVYIKLGILFIFIGLLCYAWIYSHQDNHFPIQHVKILGNYKYVPQKKLQKEITAFTDKGYFNVNVSRLRNMIVSLPGIKSVEVKRIWPNTVSITIQQQSAFAQWNKHEILSKQATIFTPRNRINQNDLPQFIGANHNAKLMIKMYQSLQVMTGNLYQIKTLSYIGNQWEIILDSNTKIMLGNNEVQKRLEQFIKYYPILSQTHKDEMITYFDARYPSGFSIKWKKIS